MPQKADYIQEVPRPGELPEYRVHYKPDTGEIDLWANKTDPPTYLVVDADALPRWFPTKHGGRHGIDDTGAYYDWRIPLQGYVVDVKVNPPKLTLNDFIDQSHHDRADYEHLILSAKAFLRTVYTKRAKETDRIALDFYKNKLLNLPPTFPLDSQAALTSYVRQPYELSPEDRKALEDYVVLTSKFNMAMKALSELDPKETSPLRKKLGLDFMKSLHRDEEWG